MTDWIILHTMLEHTPERNFNQGILSLYHCITNHIWRKYWGADSTLGINIHHLKKKLGTLFRAALVDLHHNHDVVVSSAEKESVRFVMNDYHSLLEKVFIAFELV